VSETKPFVPTASAPRSRSAREIRLWVGLGALGVAIYATRFFCTAWDFPAEQPGSGLLGAALLDGLAAPIRNYQNAYVTGSLVFGLLLVPFYALFGSSFLTLKLVSAAMVAGGLVFWTLAVRRAWGLTAAVIFFLWLVFPPPFLEWHFHQSWGGRSESLLFPGLLVWLFVRLDETPPGFFTSLGLGLLAGFASFFCFDNLAVSAALAIAAVWRWGRAGLFRVLWPAAFGFLCTFSLGLSAAALPPAVVGFSDTLRVGRVAALWRGWSELFGRLLPIFAGYRGVAGRFLSAGWSAVAAIGLVVAARCGIREKTKPSPKSALAVFAVGHIFCFAAAYGLSSQKILLPARNLFYDARYLYTLALTMLALSTLLAIQLRGAWKWLLVLPFLAGGFANVASTGARTVRDFQLGAAAMQARRGDNYYFWIGAGYSAWLKNGLTNSPNAERQALASVARLPRRWRAEGYRAVGRWLRPVRAVDLLANEPALPADARRNLAAGAGACYIAEALERGRSRQDGLVEGRSRFLAQMRALDRDAAVGFVAGVGYDAPSRASNDGDAIFICSLLPQLTDSECRRAMIEGEGVVRGEMAAWDAPPLPVDPQLMDECVSRNEPAADGESRDEARAAFRAGWAEGSAWRAAAVFNRITVETDWTELREAFAQMGITLRPTANSHQYDLEIVP